MNFHRNCYFYDLTKQTIVMIHEYHSDQKTNSWTVYIALIAKLNLLDKVSLSKIIM